MTNRLSKFLHAAKLTTTALLGLVTLAVTATGCDSPGISRKAKAPDPKAAMANAAPVGQATTTGADANAATPLGAETFKVQTQGLAVSDVIASACGIAPKDPAKTTPPSAARFDFDSAALSNEDREMLSQVAKCLADGPLRDKKVVFTGRADARGEDEYNMTLGESRADTVVRYMVDLGVGKPRMRATSRGEMDATGKDEAGFAQDRRVDIELAP